MFLFNCRVISNEIHGLRMVGISHTFSQIQNSKHVGGFEYNYINIYFTREVCLVYYSEFFFKCKICNTNKKISSTKTYTKSNWFINKAAVNSTISIDK